MPRNLVETIEVPEVGTRINKPVKGIRHRPRRAHALEVTRSPSGTGRFVLNRDRCTVGRVAGVDLQLESEEVSRHHAVLTRVDDEYTITDLDSRNGIYLGGLKVHSAVLRDGDELQLGDVFLLYHEGS